MRQEAVQTEPAKNAPERRLEVIPARMLETVLHVGVPLQQLSVTRAEAGLERTHLGFELAKVCSRATGVLFHVARRIGQQLLLQEPDARPARERDVAGVCGLEAGDDAEQRRLAHAVRPHEADPIAVREPERDVAEDEPFAESLRDRLYRKNAHRRPCLARLRAGER